MKSFLSYYLHYPVNMLSVSIFAIWSIGAGIFLALPFDSFLPAVAQLYPGTLFAQVGEVKLGIVLMLLGAFQLLSALSRNFNLLRISSLAFAVWYAFIITGYLITDYHVTSFPTEIMAFTLNCFLFLNMSVALRDLRHKDNSSNI
jgi:hypothetical protein